MPPKVQVPKEQILKAALDIVIREGPDSITYKSLAKELGRSTQTIAWKFGNMENFRTELASFAVDYFNSKIRPGGRNPVANFAAVGEAHLRLAFEAPNFIRFVRANSDRISSRGGNGAVFYPEKSAALRQALSWVMGVPEEKAVEFMQAVVVYTQGLVSMVVDGTIPISLEEGIRMMRQNGIVYMIHAGVPEETAKKLLEE